MRFFRDGGSGMIALIVLGAIMGLTAYAAVNKDRSETLTSHPVRPPSDKPEASPIKEAEAAQKVVQQKEAELLKVLKEISEATQGMQPGDMTKERQALGGFKKLIPLLKQRAAWLLGKQEEFARNMQLYQAALEKAPGAFLRAGEAYTKFAGEEEELFFKEQYLDMASRSKKLAGVMQTRAEAVKDAQAEVGQKLRFVERSVVFLNRLEEFLALYDPANDKSAEVDAYLKQLDAYITHFNQTIGAFRQLSDKIQNSTASPIPLNGRPRPR